MDSQAKIYVAGHSGLVGSALVRRLKESGYNNLILRTRQELDLLDQAAVRDFFEQVNPDFVFLAAAKVGGIMANKEQKADFIYENLAIQNNIIYNSYRVGVKKLLFLGSSCIYPKLAPQPLREECLMSDKLEETNDAYALAKIAGIKMCQSFNQQYGTNFISVMPANVYGPGDNFDLNTGHVFPVLIRRFYEAKLNHRPTVTLWGTGSAFREFLHVDDLADACLFLMNYYHGSEIINIGTSRDITIKELAEIIKQNIGYEGKIIWDVTKPDGTPRKLLDVTRLHNLGWRHRIELVEGLATTVDWFVKNQNQQQTQAIGRSVDYSIPLVGGMFLHEVETKQLLADFILRADYLSMRDQCLRFESEFAIKQGRKFAVLFNSGGSANLALTQSLKNLQLLKNGDNVGFSALTWPTNVMPIIQLGLRPVPLDCQPETLNVMSTNLKTRLETEPLKALFITNALGFVGDLENIKNICQERNILLLEDNCESLGTEIANNKAGNFGLASTFSFFVAHHMSTIEGGMVCTDDEQLADMLRIVRANGWDRNITEKAQVTWRQHFNINSNFEAKYIFYDLAFNLRPTEITGFLGSIQLKYLDDGIDLRSNNYFEVEKAIMTNPDFIILQHSHIKKLSPFALPFVCQSAMLRSKYLAIFSDAGIECRPMIAGNMQKQPFYRKYIDKYYEVPGVDILHNQGFYCGNYSELAVEDLEVIKGCLVKSD